MGKLLHLSKLQFPYLLNRTVTARLRGFVEIVYERFFAQFLIHWQLKCNGKSLRCFVEDSDTIPFITFLNDPPVAIWKAQGIS